MKSVPESVIKATLIIKATGEKLDLIEKDGSYCHFLKEEDQIPFRGEYLRFRLDWADADQNGDPTLDADVMDNEGVQQSTKIDSHHTSKTQQPDGSYVYHFRQDDVDVVFITSLVRQAKITGTSRIVRFPNP